ncbi:MAG: ATP-binding protein [Chloroflexota bacterium]
MCTSLCPCGYHVDSQRLCACAPALSPQYQKRISGPLPDRIDMAKPHRGSARGLRKIEQRPGGRSIRTDSQTRAGHTQPAFSAHGPTDIVCNADMRMGEVNQVCGQHCPEMMQDMM